jgi:hypothetical protein
MGKLALTTVYLLDALSVPAGGEPGVTERLLGVVLGQRQLGSRLNIPCTCNKARQRQNTTQTSTFITFEKKRLIFVYEVVSFPPCQ